MSPTLKWMFPLLLSSEVMSAVNLVNGNYFISYTDLICGDIEVTRTYNSTATTKGLWGTGWGSDIESRLDASPDLWTLRHNGTGRSDSFKPGSEPLTFAWAQIIGRRFRTHPELSASGKDSAWLLSRIDTNDVELLSYWSNTTTFPEDRISEPQGVDLSGPEGTRLRLLDSTWVWTNGLSSMSFDRRGNLSSYPVARGQARITRRSPFELLIHDSHGDSVAYYLNSKGFVGSIHAIRCDGAPSRERFAEYRYTPVGSSFAVGESNDMGGNRFTYSYDQRFNLLSSRSTVRTKRILRREYDSLNRVIFYADSSHPQRPLIRRYEYSRQVVGHEGNAKTTSSSTTRITTDSTGKTTKLRLDHTRLGLGVWKKSLLTPPDTLRWLYDPLTGRLLSESLGKSIHRNYEYNPSTGQIQRLMENRDTIQFLYNADGRVRAVQHGSDLLIIGYRNGSLRSLMLQIDGEDRARLEFERSGDSTFRVRLTSGAILSFAGSRNTLAPSDSADLHTLESAILEWMGRGFSKQLPIGEATFQGISPQFEVRYLASGYRFNVRATDSAQTIQRNQELAWKWLFLHDWLDRVRNGNPDCQQCGYMQQDYRSRWIDRYPVYRLLDLDGDMF